ncbi:hypothetical protein [Glutamicibacter ardleyensis]|uniref:hypothetical protein n=1 Tax=Glutamicibacter ardleyensis TaxID=225894 RepID=UPI003FD5F6A2
MRMIVVALTATDSKIRVCQGPDRWRTIQHQKSICVAKDYEWALAVARAMAQQTSKHPVEEASSNVLVEAVGRIGESPFDLARAGSQLG